MRLVRVSMNFCLRLGLVFRPLCYLLFSLINILGCYCLRETYRKKGKTCSEAVIVLPYRLLNIKTTHHTTHERIYTWSLHKVHTYTHHWLACSEQTEVRKESYKHQQTIVQSSRQTTCSLGQQYAMQDQITRSSSKHGVAEVVEHPVFLFSGGCSWSWSRRCKAWTSNVRGSVINLGVAQVSLDLQERKRKN